uniref:Neither inactivation nor afterpotential protein C n=1 Tax=Cacopsylla melanoneura TaxID=428564 RepID=A0A8D8LQT3_9HEMI
MTTWGKKWKAKSMFQVLLLYRAQRLQDLTYFCQQVHIYNQNVACVLLGDSKKSISLDKIKPGGNVNDFLGAHKAPQICKVPFRYNDILKFDPMEPKGSAFGEDESWDEPLKRGRYQGPRDKHFAYKYRDQEVQTANLDSEEVNQSLDQLSHCKKTCQEELNFIDTPYTRDPCNVRQMYSDQQYRNKYNTPKKARAPSPPRPMSRTKVPVNAYNDINQEIQNESYFRGQTPPTHRAPPPPPVRSSSHVKKGFERSDSNDSVDNSWVKTSGNNNNYSNNRDSQPVKYTPKGAPARENNPVHELQMLAKRNDNEEEGGDDPPFNFQAMLRKTNTNRASLRRVRGSDTTADNGSRTNAPNYANINGNTTTYNNINRNVDSRNKHGHMNGTRNMNNYENSTRNYDNTSRNNDNTSRNYDNTSRNNDNTSRNFDNTSRNYDNAARNAKSNNAVPGRTNFSKPEYQRTNSNDLLIQSRNNQNRSHIGYAADRIIRTELAPGIIVEGVVVDL